MRSRLGKCTNYSGCKLAYRNEAIVVVTRDFVCPECGSHLERPATRGSSNGMGILIAGVLIVLVLAVGALLWVVLSGRKTEAYNPAPPSLVAAPTPTPTPIPTPRPTPIPTPVPTPLPTPVPTPEPTPDTTVKAEVLRRIELMPDLTERQRNLMLQSLARAQEMRLLTKIAFPTGRKQLSDTDLKSLTDAMAMPENKDAIENPTLVFVVLGYASVSGNPAANLQLSQWRADTIVNELQQRFQVRNVIYPIPMGPSTLFGEDSFAQNQVAEVWLVIP